MDALARLEQVEEIFHAALKHAPPARAAFLAEACAADPSLLAEVNALLTAQDQWCWRSPPLRSTRRRAGRKCLRAVCWKSSLLEFALESSEPVKENPVYGGAKKLMLPKIEAEKLAERTLSDLHAQSLAQLLADPELTEAETQELLRQLELSDEDWQPVKLPVGAEPISETIIRLRQGELA